jgi:hypothetical protein
MRSIIYILMYDFIKLVINQKNFANDLQNNPLLKLKCVLDQGTGEIEYEFAEALGFEFKIYSSSRVEIKGSLHKYWYNGNHNDFNIYQVNLAIDSVQSTFGINPFIARLSNLEVGLNIITPFEPNGVISSLIVYKNKSFNRMDLIGPGYGKDVKFQQYKIKVYNKGLQIGKPDPILRFEKKINKMICLGQGEVYLHDLRKLEFAKYCINDLLQSFDDVILKERINKKALTKPQLKALEYCNNPLNWEQMTRKKRFYYKSQLAVIKQKASDQILKFTVADLLARKGIELLSFDPKNGNVLTGVMLQKTGTF